MNYCKYLKKSKNKPYCNILKLEIQFSLCRECGNKEYKIKTLQKTQSPAESNNHQIKKKSG